MFPYNWPKLSKKKYSTANNLWVSFSFTLSNSHAHTNPLNHVHFISVTFSHFQTIFANSLSSFRGAIKSEHAYKFRRIMTMIKSRWLQWQRLYLNPPLSLVITSHDHDFFPSVSSWEKISFPQACFCSSQCEHLCVCVWQCDKRHKKQSICHWEINCL